jgi:hypothetical protein
MGKLVLLILGCVVIAKTVEMTVSAWRHDPRVDRVRRVGRERLSKLRNGSLLLALVWCIACAGTQPLAYTTTRADRAAARDARDARLIELAKLHPNAQPRERTACPEHTPTGAVPNCPPGMKRGKPWL